MAKVESLDQAVRYAKARLPALADRRPHAEADLPGHYGAIGHIVTFKEYHQATHMGRYVHFLIMFKREWLHKFGELFGLPQELGQSIRMKLLEDAAIDNATIVIVMPEGGLYTCRAEDWLRFAKRYHTTRHPSTEPPGILEASIAKSQLVEVVAEPPHPGEPVIPSYGQLRFY